MSERDPSFALVGERVVTGDGSGPHEGLAVLVSGGSIAGTLPSSRLPPTLPRVDLPGTTIVPGFVNLHSHMVERDGDVTSKALRAARKAERDLHSGITTSRDLGAPDGLDVQLREAIANGLAAGPELIVAARPITRTGGHNHSFGREADGVNDVRRAVREQVKAGAGCIKLMASEGWTHADPHRLGLGVDEMAAAVDEAHRLGVGVTVHAQGPKAVANALHARVDSVEHATDGITDDVIELFLSSGIPLDSTSSSAWVVARWEPGPGRSEGMIAAARRHAESEREGLARCVKAGVRISGATDMHGTMAIQFRLLLEAGMDPLSAIAALTSVPAAVLGRSEIGVIAEGRRADLVVLEGDPTTDPGCLERVMAVYRAGRRVR